MKKLIVLLLMCISIHTYATDPYSINLHLNQTHQSSEIGAPGKIMGIAAGLAFIALGVSNIPTHGFNHQPSDQLPQIQGEKLMTRLVPITAGTLLIGAVFLF